MRERNFIFPQIVYHLSLKVVARYRRCEKENLENKYEKNRCLKTHVIKIMIIFNLNINQIQ